MSTDPDPPATPVIPSRIRLARDLRGLTQQQVVAELGGSISSPALSQIEAGKFRPSDTVVKQLSATLNVPQSFFMAQWPSENQSATYFRDLRSTSARDRRRAGAQALILSNFIAALEQFVRLPEVSVPSLPCALDAGRDEIEHSARHIRQLWELGSDPIPHVVRELERHGVAVARLTLGNTAVDAFSTRVGHRPLVFLTDDKHDNYVRSRLDASHELGHLVMHQPVEPGTKEVERQAQEFASSFLLPEDSARIELPSRLDAAGWSQLAEAKRTWGMSMAALLFRARTLRMISTDTYQSAMRYMSSKGWRTQEPGDREMGAPEAPILLERSVRRAEIEAGVSVESLVNYAHLPLDDILDLLETSVDERPIIEL
ncbi:helix-turn-helix domain-containing protein [Candidatus Poriferisocius sp.]|uniref:helix-turn-helix domain-containing protein n=1 Tax=Candidatus Poriferisocius sp. TaxID=3101276 RepID=UPI003B018CCC